jgi:hypothetical protein
VHRLPNPHEKDFVCLLTVSPIRMKIVPAFGVCMCVCVCALTVSPIRIKIVLVVCVSVCVCVCVGFAQLTVSSIIINIVPIYLCLNRLCVFDVLASAQSPSLQIS